MNFPIFDFAGIQFTDQEGKLTDAAQKIMDLLLKTLINGVGTEGFAVSQLTADQITVVQNNKDSYGSYTCQFGTLVYDTTNNQLKVAKDVGGVPTFTVIV